MQTIFEDKPNKYDDEKALAKYNKRVENIKKEKKLTGADIKEILIKKVKATNLLWTTERNELGYNQNPFDFIIGDEKNLELSGFEIKGDTDNYSRLKVQLQSYSYVFNKVYLVIHKHKVPDWLPTHVGVIRVFDNREAYIEGNSYMYDPLNVSTVYEWEALFKANDLGVSSKKTQAVLESIKYIRQNILFNRFFAIQDGYGTKKFKKFYPFSDEQKAVIIGFDLPYHYKLVKKDLSKLEKRVEDLKKMCAMGQTELK